AQDREETLLEVAVAAGESAHALLGRCAGSSRRFTSRLGAIPARKGNDFVARPVLAGGTCSLQGPLPVAIDARLVVARPPTQDAPELQDDHHRQNKEHDGEDIDLTVHYVSRFP